MTGVASGRPSASKALRDEVVAALRRGTVPARGLDLLAVGLDRVEQTLRVGARHAGLASRCGTAYGVARREDSEGLWMA